MFDALESRVDAGLGTGVTEAGRVKRFAAVGVWSDDFVRVAAAEELEAAVAVAEGVGVGVAVGEELGVAVGDGLGVGVGEGLGVGVEEELGVGVGVGDVHFMGLRAQINVAICPARD